MRVRLLKIVICDANGPLPFEFQDWTTYPSLKAALKAVERMQFAPGTSFKFQSVERRP